MSVDEKWLAEQAHAAGNELVNRYGWEVAADDVELDQDTAVRMLVSVGWSEGFKAGLKART